MEVMQQQIDGTRIGADRTDSDQAARRAAYEAPTVERLGDWQIVTLAQSLPAGP